jgi:hypothetical protein
MIALQHFPRVGGRRRSQRSRPRLGIFSTCRKAGAGRNLALEILDVSAEGVRLRLSEPVKKGEGVTLALPGPPGPNLECPGAVAWWARAADGTYIAGIRLHQRLSGDALARLTRD